MKEWQKIRIKKVVESDGVLFVMESGSQIPFDIKRIFFVSNVQRGKTRGDHATLKTRLVLFPVSGSCKVVVDDGRGKKESFFMDDPSDGLLIEPMIWRSMQEFSDDCVMMAVCNLPFNPGNETIDDYSSYVKIVNEDQRI